MISGGLVISAVSSAKRGKAVRVEGASPPSGAIEDRTAGARRFAVEAARVASQSHCHNVVVLDVRGISPVTDFLILASGTSPRQMKSVGEEIVELGRTHNYKPLTRDGLGGDAWVLMDFIDVVLHVFSGEARAYYDLDNLYGDAQQVEWDDVRRNETK